MRWSRVRRNRTESMSREAELAAATVQAGLQKEAEDNSGIWRTPYSDACEHERGGAELRAEIRYSERHTRQSRAELAAATVQAGLQKAAEDNSGIWQRL